MCNVYDTESEWDIYILICKWCFPVLLCGAWWVAPGSYASTFSSLFWFSGVGVFISRFHSALGGPDSNGFWSILVLLCTGLFWFYYPLDANTTTWARMKEPSEQQRAFHLKIPSQDNPQKEEHIAEVLKLNGYWRAFICSSLLTHPCNVENAQEADLEETDRTPLVMLPYIAGVSKDIRQVCRKFNVLVVFKSGRSRRSMPTKAKDTLLMEKRSRVVYQISCSCGQVEIV